MTRLYLFTGFLDSGKSSFINDTLTNEDFCDGERTLLLICEEGEFEYDHEELESFNIDLVYVDSEEMITYEFFEGLKAKYNPTQVMIEYNGMWNVNKMMACSLPDDWSLVQVLTTIDASTFALYIQNMRSLVYQHSVHSDLLIFNRINKSQKKSFLRNNIKAINSSCQIIYEMEDGSIDAMEDEELPFDITSSQLDILDHDFGLFCMDALTHPDKYHHKTVTLRGKFIGRDKQIKDGFIMGREAMVCCEDDTSLVGMVCVHNACSQLIPNEWVQLTGLIEVIYDEEVGNDICVLYVDELKVIPPLENEYVTFD